MIADLNPVEPYHDTCERPRSLPEILPRNHGYVLAPELSALARLLNHNTGMTLVRTSENTSAGFNLYFLGYGSPPNNTAHREGLLELTWNYGTEKDGDFKYHNGNDEPQGFGHIAVSVDDLNKACERFEAKGVSWKKRLTDGRMKNVAFVLDPDGYWIEVKGFSAGSVRNGD